MASIRQLIIGTAIAVAISAVGVSVIGNAVALAPAAQRAQATAPQPRGDQATLPDIAGSLSEHQQLRRIFIDEARARLR